MDEEAKKLIAGVDLGVQFSVPEVGQAVLTFKDGKCTFTRGKGKAALKLYFGSPEHFNNLIAPPIDPKTGKPKMVIPIFYNVFKMGFLLNTFQKLADRMSYFLQPAADKKAELLQDKKYFEINTMLTAYTAFFAMSEIANSDFVGKAIARRMPDGAISLKIGEATTEINAVSALNISIANHVFTSGKGEAKDPRATMVFSDMQFTHDLLNGNTSSFTGMGTGQFQICGFVEMLEQMAKLLTQVSVYLA
jgi:hypothetical protein